MKLSPLYQKFFLLPVPLRQEVLDFIDFLLQKYRPSQDRTHNLADKRKRNFGRLKGKIIMESGFDDPIEGFEKK